MEKKAYRQPSVISMLSRAPNSSKLDDVIDIEDSVDLSDEQIASLENVPAILDGTYFKITKLDNGAITATCVFCAKKYNGTLRSTSNFLKHLKKNHETMMAKYEAHKNLNAAVRSKKRRVDGDIVALPVAVEASSSTASSNMFRKSWQKQADILVTNVIIDSALPIRLVEVPAFKELVAGLSKMPEPVHCLSQKTVAKCIEDRYRQMKDDIVDKLKSTNYVCTTADIWSSRKRSFLGVTVHWLNKSFQRESYAIACTRFKGSHNFSTIAKHISNAHHRYGLGPNKIVFTVTDNASNMVKAFKEFGYVDCPSDEEIESDNEEVDENEKQGEDEVNIESISELISSNQDWDAETVSLPQHVRCATHTLNLIATVDLQKAIESKSLTANSFERTHRLVMTRCFKHWNILSRSANKASETFIAKLGHLVRLPCPTRWNSLFDALTDLSKLDSVKLHEFSAEMGIEPLLTTHIEFIKEFLICLQPIAVTLDKLQGETQLVMADLIPCILNAQFLLKKVLENPEVRICKDMINVLVKSLENRFQHVFQWDGNKDISLPFVLATVSSPKWKLRWINTSAKKTLASQWMVEEAMALEEPQIADHDTVANDMQAEQEFYSFMSFADTMPVNETANLQVVQYTSDSNTHYSCLGKYPLIEKLFFKFNAGLPSSAPVERLFSYAGLVLTAKRAKLKDEKFEMLTLLKANK